MTIDRILLYPYYLVLKLRDRHYRAQGRKFYSPEVPSVCVGNITAGGTGKTPMVELILRLLNETPKWRGKNFAVLSRGYKRESKGFQQVIESGTATMYGDEPMQIKRKFPQVTVAVDKDRVEGCELLCHPDRLESSKYVRKCWNRNFSPAEFIILDDAYQYRKLRARVNVVLVDYNRPVFEDMLLPLGRLRDLHERVGDADVVVVTKCPRDLSVEQREEFATRLGVSGYSLTDCYGKSARGRSQKIFFSYIRYNQPVGVYPTTEARYIYSKKAILVSGIAHDGPLREYLSDSYKIVKRFSFPDHHKYTWSDIDRIQSALRRNPTAFIVTTEKDAQRLADFNGMPSEISERLFMVPIETEFLSEEERNIFKAEVCA